MKFKGFAVKLTVTAIILAVLVVCFFVFFGKIINALVYIIGLLAPFIIAYPISLAAHPLAEKLQKKFKLPKGLTAVLVIILIVGIVGGILTGITWKIVSETKSIYLQLPQIYDKAVISFGNISDKLSNIYDNIPVDFQSTIDSLGDKLQSSITGFINDNYKPMVSGAGNLAKALPSIFIGIIVFILSLFFMISNEDNMRNIASRLIPSKTLEGMRVVGGEIKKYLGGYLKAQLIIMSIAFVIIFIGLSILKTEYSMLIALGIAVLDALPFFGSGAVLIPWSVISFLSSDIRSGVGLLIIYLSVIFTRQMIEPKIVSSNIGINPLFTLMSMYIGYRVFSIGGMILGPIILMLCVSFYKAGAFDSIIKLCKKLFLIIKNEIMNLIKFISLK